MKKLSLKIIFRFIKGKFKFRQKESSYIYGSVYLDRQLKFKHGKGLSIYGNLRKVSFFGTGSIILGDYVFINNGTIFESRAKIQIGNNVKIGYNALFIDTTSHSIDGITPSKALPIIIEDNVWIASNAIILAGVRIGKNSVIASGATVNKNVPTDCLYGGVPAKLIKDNIYKSDKPRV